MTFAKFTFLPNPLIAAELAHSAEVNHGMDEAADAALQDAQAHVPVDTGELLASLHVEDGPDGGKRIVAGTDHWLYPEFGTEFMDSTPFLRPIIANIGLHL